jgi:hypothetical protein
MSPTACITHPSRSSTVVTVKKNLQAIASTQQEAQLACSSYPMGPTTPGAPCGASHAVVVYLSCPASRQDMIDMLSHHGTQCGGCIAPVALLQEACVPAGASITHACCWFRLWT